MQSVVPIKAANDSFMTACNLSAVWLPWTHDQKLLTLQWCSFSRWGREGISICFAYKGGQWFLYDRLQPIGYVITQNAWPIIVDAPLTLIVIMGQEGYCNLFCLQKQPMIPLWLPATYRQCDYPECMTNHCWRSVDAHYQHGAGRLSQSVFPKKAANDYFMTACNLSAVWLPRPHDQ